MNEGTIESLQIEISASAKQANAEIDSLASSISGLKAITKGGAGLTTIANQIKRLNESFSSFKNPAAEIRQLVEALKPLETVGKTNLNSSINSLRKLPDVAKSLSEIDMGAFATEINRVVDAIRPLAAEMNKVAAGFAAFPSRIKRLITMNTGLAGSNSKLKTSYFGLNNIMTGSIFRFGLSYAAMTRLSRGIASAVENSAGYTETLNLFTISLGKYADQALEYAKVVERVAGIDHSAFVENLAIYNRMLTGYGTSIDKAYKMSTNLTQLGYDISSYFNLSIADANEKLQAAIAGQIKPLRPLGYDTSVQALQELYDRLTGSINGATNAENVRVSTMTRAQKAQLTYLKIMESSSTVMGDWARTVHTPASALRILNEQLTMTARAIGNVFIPIIMAALPYIMAFFKALRMVADTIAGLFGFEITKIDYSNLGGLQTGLGDIEEDADNASDAIGRLKNQVTGLDELNIINPDSSSGIGGGLGSGLDIPGLEDLEIYDFLSGMDELNAKTDELAEKLAPVLTAVLAIGAAILAWKLGSAIFTGLSSLRTGLSAILTGTKSAEKGLKALSLLDFAVVVGGLALIVAYLLDAYNNSEDFRRGLQEAGNRWDEFKGSVGRAWNSVSEGFKAIGEAIFGVKTQSMEAETPVKELLLALAGVFALATGHPLIAAGLLGTSLFGWATKNAGARENEYERMVELLEAGEITSEEFYQYLDQYRTDKAKGQWWEDLLGNIEAAGKTIQLQLENTAKKISENDAMQKAQKKIFKEMDDQFREDLRGVGETIATWWDENFKPFFDKERVKKEELDKSLEVIHDQYRKDLQGVGDDIQAWYQDKFKPFFDGAVFTRDNLNKGLEPIHNQYREDLAAVGETIREWYETKFKPFFDGSKNEKDKVGKATDRIRSRYNADLNETSSDILNWFTRDFKPYFDGTLVDEFKDDGLGGVKTQQKVDLADMGRQFDDWLEVDVKRVFSRATWWQIGYDAIQGLFSGLGNFLELIQDWGRSLVENVENFFDSHSPARKYWPDIGEGLMGGLAVGMMSAIPETVRQVGGALVDAFGNELGADALVSPEIAFGTTPVSYADTSAFAPYDGFEETGGAFEGISNAVANAWIENDLDKREGDVNIDGYKVGKVLAKIDKSRGVSVVTRG